MEIGVLMLKEALSEKTVGYPYFLSDRNNTGFINRHTIGNLNR